MLVPCESTQRSALNKHYHVHCQIHQRVIGVYTASEYAFENFAKTVQCTVHKYLTQ